MDFETQLTGFVAGAQKVIDDYYTKEFPTQGKKLVLERGSKNIRIVAKDVWQGQLREESGSAWAFIEIATGTILKPASVKAPAKGSRGTIMEEGFGVHYITPYGPPYLSKGRKAK